MGTNRKMPEVTDAERMRAVERQCRMLREQRNAARAENERLRDGIVAIIQNRDSDAPDDINGDFVLADLHDLIRDDD